MSAGTLMRRWCGHAAASALLALLAACGGGGSSSDAPAASGSPAASSPPAATSPSTGTTGSTTTSSGTTTTAPATTTASDNTPISTSAPVVAAGANVLPIVLDRGTDLSAINSPFVAVTVCEPGTQTCRVIDHILLDTGSVGLRLTAASVRGMNLPAVTGTGARALAECASFASGYTWGAVRSADVRLASEQASGLSVQVMNDPGSVYATVPADCANTGAPLPDAGSNGILGVGFSVQDCGPACASSASPGMYFSCTALGCSSVAVPLATQVAHPVASLAGTDNNGLAIVLPDVAVGGSPGVTGALVLGVGTRDNNQLGTAPVYTANSVGNFTTTYKGQSSTAFIDSGSNGIFFADSGIRLCASGFYCPPAALSLSATAVGTNGASVAVPFVVENASALPDGTAAARLGGSVVLGRSFDWGLPFFFGRTVFVAITGRSTPAGVGPFWAF